MKEANEILYSDAEQIVSTLKKNAPKYFKEILGTDKNAVIIKIRAWESKIENDIQEYSTLFDKAKWATYEKRPNIFKDAVLPSLWTVGAALTSHDQDLIRYKGMYKKTPPLTLFNAYKQIFLKAEKYVQKTGSKINFDTLKHVHDLKQDFFSDEDMTLVGVIGYGIRSEFLYKSFPNIFSLMTRRSLWSMYFITSSEEFILLEKGYSKYSGHIRYITQFNYDYMRFNFYSNIIAKLLAEYIKPFGIVIQNDFRFGYTNYFLSDCFKTKKDISDSLHEWRKI